jgi:hypothetical protein
LACKALYEATQVTQDRVKYCNETGVDYSVFYRMHIQSIHSLALSLCKSSQSILILSSYQRLRFPRNLFLSIFFGLEFNEYLISPKPLPLHRGMDSFVDNANVFWFMKHIGPSLLATRLHGVMIHHHHLHGVGFLKACSGFKTSYKSYLNLNPLNILELFSPSSTWTSLVSSTYGFVVQ